MNVIVSNKICVHDFNLSNNDRLKNKVIGGKKDTFIRRFDSDSFDPMGCHMVGRERKNFCYKCCRITWWQVCISSKTMQNILCDRPNRSISDQRKEKNNFCILF